MTARALLGAALCLLVPPLAAAVSAVDDAGSTIALPAPALRIVSLAPHITEQLFAVGAGSRIVGTTDHADHPPAARAIARVARAHSVDLERVAALQPDLIVVWGSGYPPAVIDALRRLRVPVYVNEPGTLDSIATSLERLGRLAGGDGAAAAAQLRAQLDALRRQFGQRAPVAVFYQVWSAPLMTLSGRHVLSEALRVCGGRNVFDNLVAGPIAPTVSIEAVLAAQPAAIVTAEAAGLPTAALDMWRRYRALPAVANQRLFTLNADRINRHGPRLPDELARLCELIDSARRTP